MPPVLKRKTMSLKSLGSIGLLLGLLSFLQLPLLDSALNPLSIKSHLSLVLMRVLMHSWV